MKILVLNAGSSSQKSCLYDLPEAALPPTPRHPVWEGFLDLTHAAGVAEMKVKTAHGAALTQTISTDSRDEANRQLLATLWQGETQVIDRLSDLTAVGHRVVHGGQTYQASTPITPEVKAEIDRLAKFAPVHNPVNLAGIEAITALLGDEVPQFAVFDTAFHSTLPPAAYVYPGSYDWLTEGIRRYGFHGTSHRYCTARAADLLGRNVADLRLIICHLGNGASLTAVQGGRSIDTTMGFTPLDGLMMGSRSGAIDPGILIHLLRQQGYSADQLDHLLNRESGLKGISGLSSDLRQVVAAAEAGQQRAQLAIAVYVHRLRSYLGAMLVQLGGVDAIVFTAGVGENSSLIRAQACASLGFLGLTLDEARNQAGVMDSDIATADSAVRVLIIHTEEDWTIATECWRLLKSL